MSTHVQSQNCDRINIATHLGWHEIQYVNTCPLLLQFSTVSTLLFVIQQYGFGLDGVMGFPYLWA